MDRLEARWGSRREPRGEGAGARLNLRWNYGSRGHGLFQRLLLQLLSQGLAAAPVVTVVKHDDGTPAVD
ncbi:MAG: hypothetical protein HC824_03795 [Synechococcales cyanobacterium RM1_1_8]|nr:hypothetical protein [Synechococcales cyanobacterium RM1_1_8]